MSTNEQAARDEAEKRTRPRGSRPGNDASYVDGFVRGALWAESALLARLSDDALVEAVHVAYWEGWRSAAADKPFPGDVAARAALAAVAAHLAGGEQ